MKVGFIITARLKSTRLPKKVLLDLGGKHVIIQMIDRIKRASQIDQIIVATSTHPQDDELVLLLDQYNIASYRGHESDVLDRLHRTASFYDLDYIVNVTADCPLVDPQYIDRVVDFYRQAKDKPDLITCFDLPHGMYSYGIKPSALEKVLEIKQSDDTEVWGKYFTDLDCFHTHQLKINPTDRSRLRLTLDYPEDYEMLKALYAGFDNNMSSASVVDVIQYCNSHPDLIAINNACDQLYRVRSGSQGNISLKERYAVNRALLVGCGSIGKRHIRNLMALGVNDIVAFRTREGASKDLPSEWGIREYSSWEEVLKEEADVAIIANPSNLHIETMRKLMGQVKGIFVEKPMAHTMDGVNSIQQLINTCRPVTFAGFNLRFHPLIMKIRDILQSERIGKPMTLQIQVGQWLPDWHPNEDYRQLYAANRSLGGGALLSLIHEVQMVLDWVGPSKRVAATFPTSDLLDLDVDVKANLMIEHVSGAISQLHIDLIQKPMSRSGMIICQKGQIRYDLLANSLHVDAADGGKSVLFEGVSAKEAFDDSYRQMMQCFLQYVKEGRYRHAYDFGSGIASLSLAQHAFASGASQSWETTGV